MPKPPANQDAGVFLCPKTFRKQHDDKMIINLLKTVLQSARRLVEATQGLGAEPELRSAYPPSNASRS